MKNYQNKYTDRGHSIKLLRKEAKILSKERQITLTEAKEVVAGSYGYPGWHYIATLAPDENRDDFFRHVYKSGLCDNLFKQYAFENSLDSSKESLRLWALDTYDQVQPLNYTPNSSMFKIYSVDKLLESIPAILNVDGVEGFLPQNLHKNVLGSLINCWQLYKSAQDERGIDPIFAIIMIINAWPDKSKVKIGIETLLMQCEVYVHNLRLENMDRCSEMSFAKPTLETVLDMNAEVVLEVPQGLVDKVISRKPVK